MGYNTQASHKKVNFLFHLLHLGPKFRYAVRGKVGLAGLPLDPPIILSKIFYCFHEYIYPSHRTEGRTTCALTRRVVHFIPPIRFDILHARIKNEFKSS